jgi:glycosyltransferase involved in cell wall biosynthesis
VRLAVLIAYEIDSERGSEAGNSWHWLEYWRQRRQVLVVTSDFRGSMPDGCVVEVIERREHGWLGERAVFIDWLRRVKARLQSLHLGSDSIVHFVSWASLSAPIPSPSGSVPVIWGPVGGGQEAPPTYARYLGPATLGELVRNARTRAVPHVRRVLSRRERRTTLAIAANSDTRRRLIGAGFKVLCTMHDNAVPEGWIKQPRTMPYSRPHQVLWVGRLERHKAARIAVDVVERVLERVPVVLNIVGTGRDQLGVEEYARGRGIADSVHFHGSVPHWRVGEMMHEASVLLFTSLRDTCAPVIFESLGAGLPVVALNHQGMLDFSDEGILKVPVRTPPPTVKAMADALQRILADETLWKSYSESAIAHAIRRGTWQSRYKEMDVALTSSGIVP